MPVTNAQIAALPTYTAAEQLKVWQKASIDLAMTGQSMGGDGRMLTRADAGRVAEMISFWTEQVALESAGSDCPAGVALVVRGERQ
jgi:hypothetical protein